MVWRLQAETQQMGLALKRGHLWGGTEAERVTVSGFLHCIAVLWLRGLESRCPVQLWEDAPGTRL